VRFWDTSSLVPLLLHEDATAAVVNLGRADPDMAVSWITLVECGSAIARRERDQIIDQDEVAAAFARLDDLARTWHEVEPTNETREIARRLLRAHALRAADAIQIASATLAAERRPSTLEFVTLDGRLEAAASKEGFVVVVPGRNPPG
jgi:predicted nucleic acid-binding protein